ncbi:MAG: phage holin family protein [Acidobacteriota bacterium]
MADTFTILKELSAAAGRLTGLVLDLAGDRLELLGIEAREVKIRLIQLVLLAVCGAALLLFGLGLAVLAVLLAVPPTWRLPVAAGGAAFFFLAGALALFGLRRRLARLPLAFSQTVEEIRKDQACF